MKTLFPVVTVLPARHSLMLAACPAMFIMSFQVRVMVLLPLMSTLVSINSTKPLSK